ncbi:DUF2332 domain-containing protein [Evansella sp. LMS18]|uniref:DUF2332 domain-containing protein n=1 Tax=Evansella sp. LMS18 TaxID=2924033 RepID=UPI0020D10453|nr:DUF2332 domain-containing protein [Evansella sp. LMS18]UTR13048.1 DUF2332 domain-containing protein [Evansella sp. LMS18]
MEYGKLANKFNRFATEECRGSSELYEYLSLQIAQDKEILELASHSQPGQPVPNLLLGAVHYLLLRGKEHKLKYYYPSIVPKPQNMEEIYPYFKDFCMENRGEIISLLKKWLVQTNEVRRCSYLYPVFNYIYETVKKPLALIEIGTSAGLQLLWDKYSYSYGTDEVYGNTASNVTITSEVRGANFPAAYMANPPVAVRIGVDLNTIDLTNEDEYLWLQALIWPEHEERRELLSSAAEYVKKSSVTLIEGDGTDLLMELEKEISEKYAICVFHTHVANQMPQESKSKLLKNVEEIGEKREIFHLYNNIFDGNLHLDFYSGAQGYRKKVGETDGHGRWFTWELDNLENRRGTVSRNRNVQSAGDGLA